MSLSVNDRIATTRQRATAAEAIAGLKALVTVTNTDEAFALALSEACEQAGIDFAFAWAHACNESDFLRDHDYRFDNNAFGIGHPDNSTSGVIFRTKRECARFYVGELLLKLRRPIPASLSDARSYAPDKFDQVRAVVNLGTRGQFPDVARIADLAARFGINDRECVWMCDPNGPEAIVAKGRALFPHLPDQEDNDVPSDLTFGKVPHPAFQTRDIPSSVNTAWNDLGSRTIRGVVWHRMLGSLWGTDGYFRGDGRKRALTDYGIGVEEQDGDAADGLILRWNDPRGTRSPWANGSLSNPYGDGLAFYNRYGVEGINRDLVSIEISGFQATPLSEASRNAIAGLTAYWADQARIPWTEWPMVPGEDRSFVCWHEEFTIGTGKRCPFDAVKAETAALIERTRGILKQHQAATKPPPIPVYDPPIVPDWLTEDLERGYPTDHAIDGGKAYGALRVYTAIRATNRLQGPDPKGPKVGPRLKVRERFRGLYRAVVDGRGYIVTEYGSWISDGALTPRISIRER